MNPNITTSRVTHWVNAGRRRTGCHRQPRRPGDPRRAGQTGRPPGRTSADASGVIGTATDTDWFRIVACQAGATISAEPADVFPNLDLRVTLLNSAGTSIATHAPPTTRLAAWVLRSRSRASAVRPWYVVVDGVGSGPDGADQPFAPAIPITAAWAATPSMRSAAVWSARPPSAPRDVRATTAGRPRAHLTTMISRAPASTGSAGLPLLRYDVSLDDGGGPTSAAPPRSLGRRARAGTGRRGAVTRRAPVRLSCCSRWLPPTLVRRLARGPRPVGCEVRALGVRGHRWRRPRSRRIWTAPTGGSPGQGNAVIGHADFTSPYRAPPTG